LLCFILKQLCIIAKEIKAQLFITEIPGRYRLKPRQERPPALLALANTQLLLNL
jgi:hypothetical protein